MKRSALVIVAVLVVAASSALVFSRIGSMDSSAEVADQAALPEPLPMTTTAGGAATRRDAGHPELDPFDCTAPTGNVARVDGQGITARALCKAWQRIASAAELRGVDALEAQRKLLLDAMIDACLVHGALAKAGKEVTEAEVDAALDALVVQQRVSSRAEFEQGLRAQGGDVEDVRAELRRRLERERLVELRKPIEPPRLLEELRAQAKIEYLK